MWSLIKNPDSRLLQRGAFLLIVALLVPSLGIAEDERGIGDLISDLESSDFRARQQATRELRKRGAIAIKLLEKRVRKGRLELAVRAMSIFEHAYIGSDQKAAFLADEALESFAESERQALGELAKAVLVRNRATRVDRAIKRLRSLGAEVKNYNPSLEKPRNIQDFGRPTDNPYVAIDENWKGGVAGLKYIRRLNGSAFQIYMVNTAPLEEKAVVELEAAFDGDTVHRRGPLLGILSGRGGNGVQVNDAVEGTAAHEAGIKPGDFIEKIDNKELTDFDHLIEELMRRKPGDTVTFTVIRTIAIQREREERVETKEIKVTLRSWRNEKKEAPAKPIDPAPQPEKQPPADK